MSESVTAPYLFRAVRNYYRNCVASGLSHVQAHAHVEMLIASCREALAEDAK
jgi:hypothetical protein